MIVKYTVIFDFVDAADDDMRHCYVHVRASTPKSAIKEAKKLIVSCPVREPEITYWQNRVDLMVCLFVFEGHVDNLNTEAGKSARYVLVSSE